MLAREREEKIGSQMDRKFSFYKIKMVPKSICTSVFFVYKNVPVACRAITIDCSCMSPVNVAMPVCGTINAYNCLHSIVALTITIDFNLSLKLTTN